MAKFVKIGTDVINLDEITRISFVENQSGLSDRIVISIGSASVTVDSAIGGRERMEEVRRRLLSVLAVEEWDSPAAADGSISEHT